MSVVKEVCASSPLLEGMIPYDPKYMQADVMISANESPHNLPAEIRESIAKRLMELDFNRYPDPLGNKLRKMLADHWGVQTQNVLLGNGGDELLFDICAAWGGSGRTMLNFPPTFSVYQTNAELTGTQVVNLPRDPETYDVDVDNAVKYLQENKVELVILTSPNNPTGNLTSTQDVKRILDATDALVLVDEAYGEFADQTCQELLDEYENLIILHTFSKAYRCAGVRLGYVLANPKVLNEFKKVRQPYSVDAISQIIGEEVIANAGLFKDSISQTRELREELIAKLNEIEGVTAFPSESNFIMFHITGALEIWEHLHKDHSVLIRNVSGDTRLPGCLRVSVGTREENEKFLAALSDIVSRYQTL